MSYDINLKHLEYFIKVARLGSINKAAQMLYVSQSHLGKIIHDLEETVGAPLLNRSRQGVTLTPEGNEFLERSVRILKEMEEMHLRPLKEMEKTEPLAVSMTKFSHVMESFITIVRRYQDQPEFTHRLYEGQLEDVIEDVVSGRADIGIFHFDSQRHEEIQVMAAAKGLTYRFLSYVEPQIVISKDHPLVREKKPMTRENLANYGFIRYMGLYDDILSNILGPNEDGGSTGKKKEIYVTGRATLMNLISQTDFYSIGIHDFDKQLSDFRAVSVPIPGCEVKLEFGYVTLADVPISGIGEEFLKEVRERRLFADARAYIYSMFSPWLHSIWVILCISPTLSSSFTASTSVSMAEKPLFLRPSLAFSGSDTIILSIPYSVVSAMLSDRMLMFSSFSTSVTCSSLPSRFSMNTDNCFTNISIPAFPKSVSCYQLHALSFPCCVQCSLVPPASP